MSYDFLQLAVKGVQGLKPYLPGKPMSELQRELGLTEISKLASNENPLPPSLNVLAAIQAELSDIARYPDGSGFELKAELERFTGLNSEQITLGNGSNDVLVLLAEAFLQPGRNAVFSEYCFAVYPIATWATGSEARFAKALPADHKKMPLGHDLDAIYDQIDKNTAIVFIANPNNPTGTWLETDDLKAFMQKVPEHVVIVIDEAYHEYQPDDQAPNAISWVDDYNNLVVTRTFSKAYGLAGLRVGYALSSAKIANIINRIRQPFNVNSLALAAAVAGLKDQPYIEKVKQQNSKGMQAIQQIIDKLGLSYCPSRGNFLLVDFAQDALALNQKFLEKGVIVRPVANYGLPKHLRISIGSDSENAHFERVINELLA
ncbi:MAG: histidinol-phosphate transaminase [bacterium]